MGSGEWGMVLMATHMPFLGSFAGEGDAPMPDWERPVSAIHLAPLKPRWTTDPPTHPGIWWVRWPGHQSKVVQIHAEDGRLFYSWTDVEPTPVLRDGVLQWSNRSIVEPT